MNIKAAIFDMDGTLIDSLIFWDLLWTDLGKCYLNDVRHCGLLYSRGR